MAAPRNNRRAQPVEREAERPEPIEVESDDAEVEVDLEPEAEEGRPRRKSKARAPARSASPLRERLRKKSTGGSGERRPPMQGSLWSVMTQEIMSQRAAKVGGGLILFIGLIGGLVIGFYFFAGSRFFELRGVDVEPKEGELKLLSPKEVEMWVRANVDNGVLRANLTIIRDELEKRPLIREAQVIRL